MIAELVLFFLKKFLCWIYGVRIEYKEKNGLLA